MIRGGAHKTASTHFERSLSELGPLLEKRKIAVLPPAVMYDPIEQITNKVVSGVHPDTVREDMTAALAELAPGAETILMFDENLLGGTQSNLLFDEGCLYPWAGRRLKRFKSVLPEEAKVRVGLATRNLATFLPSAYGESLHHGPYVPFDTYLNPELLPSLSWANLVERLREAMECPVFVWRFEDYPEVGTAVVNEILGRGLSTKFSTARAPDRVGLSARAIEEIEKAHRNKKAKPDAKKLRQTYPKSVLYPGFKPFASEIVEELSTRYDADFAEMAEMRRVSLIARTG